MANSDTQPAAFDFVDAIPVAALVISKEDALIAANGVARQLLPGLRENRSYITAIRQPALEALIGSARNGMSVSGYIRHTSAGVDHKLNVRCGPLPQGHVLMCLVDESDADAATQARQDFVANVSHELRSPLTAISTVLETLQGPAKNDPAAVERFLPLMGGEVVRMQNLVSDLLALSKVESNERRLPRDIVILQDAIRAAVESLQPMVEKLDAELKLDLPENPLAMRGDFDELRRAALNLVENALRYGASPVTVSLAAPVTGVLPGKNAAILAVADQGKGLEAHHIPRLTERFYRVDAHRSRNDGGTGLGLAIVKHIVTRHRGRLGIVSNQGEGTTVSLTLPLAED
jgi:two-component system phosphate regulon sensor histidine kinase PhoR